MPTFRAFPNPKYAGAPGSNNVDTRFNRVTAAFQHFILDDDDRLHYPVRAIEYKAPTGIGGQPRQYCGQNRTVRRLDDGDDTDDQTFDDVIQGMVICDSGGATTNQDAIATGTPILFVTFGSSATVRNAVRNLTTDTTPWFTHTNTTLGTGDAQVWQVEKVAGGNLVGVTDGGLSGGIGDWRISICAAGNDPTLEASWGNGIEVGGPEWIITGLAVIGDSITIGKPDGLYYFDDLTKKCINVLPHLVNAPHALNGKGMQAVTNGVLYPTHDGKLYFYDGVAVTEVTPEKSWGIVPRDVGTSRITAIADNGDTVAVVTETAQNSTQNVNMDVFIVDPSDNSNTVTSVVDDGDFTTGVTVGLLGAGYSIDVWADVPFEGAIFHVTRNANTTAAAVFGTVSYSSASSIFTAFSTFIDNTILGTGNGSLSYVAYPPSASSGVVRPRANNVYDLQQRVDYTYLTGPNITNKYGMRFTIAGGTFSAGTTIDEVEVIPARAGVPLTAVQDFTHIDRAGLTSHVYLGKRERTTGFTWYDAYTLDTYGGVWAIAWHSGRLGQPGGNQNTGQALVLWGRHRTIAISESPTRDPARTLYPVLAEPDSTRPAPLWNITPDGWDGDRPDVLKQISQLRVQGRYIQPDDNLRLFMQFNADDCIQVGESYGAPAHFDLTGTPPFRWCNLWLELVDNSTIAPNAMQIRTVEWDWDVAGPRIDGQLPQDSATPTPELT